MRRFVGMCLAGIILVLAADIWWFDSDDYRVAANLSLVYLTVFTAVFTVRYAGWSDWRASRIGPTYLMFKLVMTLVLTQIVASTWWDLNYPYRHQIRFVIYSVGAVFAIPMIAALVREQEPDHDDDDKPKPRRDVPPL